ncbi:replication factor C subunit 1 isoform X2 [Halyomorpha halys]|uniref:replication factor C subunit 1 isoform X2 n=1 Tax=Halyomorpha halys TaxID=286706 RepID=UPI0006D4C705|nr:replication factor C subunit 1 isoform X2 [Halyomorpha halys]
MGKDIRSYFSKTPESKKTESKAAKNTLDDSVNKKKKSRKRVLIDSDSEEEKPILKKEKAEKKDTKEKTNKNGETSKYFEVSKKDVAELLGKTPVKRTEQPKAKKGKKDPKLDLVEDIDWDDVPDFPTEDKNSTTLKNEMSTVQSPLKNVDSSEKLQTSDSGKPGSIVSPEKDEEKTVINSRLHEMSPSPERIIKPTPEKKSGKKHLSEEENGYKNKKQKLTDSVSLSPVKNTSKEISSKHSKSPVNSKIPSTPLKKNNVEIKQKIIIDPQYSLWVEKYKPTSLKQIIGQQGEKSNVNKLVKWLTNWFDNQSGKKKISKPSPWAKDDSGAYFKAALLSGSPGVGKTTTAHLVCKELGMDIVEFNASDTRSKKSLQEEIKELLSSKSLASYALDGKVSNKHVLVMDEVDGMAGNEDRGGVQELILLIKSAKVPVICMCNDRNHPKIRSLANYCFDLRFSKPRADQIRGAMMSVCFKEGLKVKPEVLSDIITSTNQDIRLILNHLSVLSAQASLNLPMASKYIKLGPWDVLRKVFSKEEHKNMSIYDKCDLFFYDYSIAPLFVQENYLNVQPHSEESKTKRGKMMLFAKAARSIAYGDLVDNKIRSNSAWGLLPVQAVFSSLLPGEYLAGHMGGQINFPAWLGKNSRRGKLDRFAQEILAHTRLKVLGSKEAVNLDYCYALREKVLRPLFQGTEGIEESLSVMREYCILREDIESLSELTAWPGIQDPFSKIDSKVKANFTRTYNKNPIVTPFSINAAVKKGRGVQAMDEAELEDDAENANDEEEDQDDVTKDAMILIKKKTNKEEKEQKKKEAGGSKPRGGKRGKK